MIIAIGTKVTQHAGPYFTQQEYLENQYFQ
jgi:hypothetical protein